MSDCSGVILLAHTQALCLIRALQRDLSILLFFHALWPQYHGLLDPFVYVSFQKISVIKEQRGIVTNPELIEAVCVVGQAVAGRLTMAANQLDDVIQRWVSEQQIV